MAGSLSSRRWLLAPCLLICRNRGRAGCSRHRNLHRRKDHGAADQLPAEQCRFPAEDDRETRRRPSAEAGRRQGADRRLEEQPSPPCRRSWTTCRRRRRKWSRTRRRLRIRRRKPMRRRPRTRRRRRRAVSERALVMAGQEREARLRARCPGHPRPSCRKTVKTWMPGTRLRQGFAGPSSVSPPKL